MCDIWSDANDLYNVSEDVAVVSHGEDHGNDGGCPISNDDTLGVATSNVGADTCNSFRESDSIADRMVNSSTGDVECDAGGVGIKMSDVDT